MSDVSDHSQIRQAKNVMNQPKNVLITHKPQRIESNTMDIYHSLHNSKSPTISKDENLSSLDSGSMIQGHAKRRKVAAYISKEAESTYGEEIR